MINRRSFVVGVAAISAPVLFASSRTFAQDAIPAGAQEAAFISAVDGEKMRVRIGADIKSVRLIGTDAPEIGLDKDHTECFAIDSRDFLGITLADQTVYLEGDAEDKDRKDRLWRYVWANLNGVPTLMNEYVIAQGAAVTQKEEKNMRYQDRLAKAEVSAKAGGLGLWGSCENDPHKKVARHGSKEEPGAFGEALIGENVSVAVADPLVTTDYNYSTPKGGYKFLIFNVSIVNQGEGKKEYESRRFEVRDLDTDVKHKEAFVLLDQPLNTGTLSPGSYVDGQVALEVQETATNMLVQYQIDSSGDTFLYWTLTL